MCGYRTYKTLKGLNKYVQSAAKAANRKAPEITEATEAEAVAETNTTDATKVAADQVREARATVDPTTTGRITTFDTIAEAIEGIDNLIAWEYADCPDDYDLRAIAEAITCERCGKLAVLPTYDELSDQFDASALWKVVESHYTGDDDPEPTDPTDPATDADEATDEAEGFDATGIPTES
jgi:hypothetical protein